jgi:hypothetical protein
MVYNAFIQWPSKVFLLFLVLIGFLVPVKSQNITPFNVLPDFGGIDGVGTAWHVYPDSDFIYVIGNTDTSFYGSLTQPVLARFDYEGHLLNYNTIVDSTSDKHMTLDESPIIKEPNGFTMFISRWSLIGSPYNEFIKFNKDDGEIIQQKTPPRPPNLHYYPDIGLYYKTPDGRYIISGYIGDEADQYYAKFDSSFELMSEFIVPAMNRWNWAGYLKEQPDGSLIVAGYSELFPYAYVDQPFLMHVSPTGEMLEFLLAPDSLLTNFSSTFNTVLKNEEGNWIFSGIMDHSSFGCDTCSKDIPFVCAISPDFDSLLWVRYLSYQPLASEIRSIAYIMKEATDHSGYVSTIIKISETDNLIYLSKVSPDGDSLWTRTIAPLGWENEDSKRMNIWQLAATPYNTFVGVGTVEDQNGPNRPWLFQLDSVGCLVPGCDQQVSVHEILEGATKDFIIYPNPVSGEIYISYQGTNTFQTDFTIILTTTDGKTIKTTSLHPMQHEQYILPLPQIPAGQYILSIENGDGSYRQSEIIIKKE